MKPHLLAAAFASVAASLSALPAAAEEPPYLDDRSDPAALVRSLYNAVSRQEYARAWSYFGDTKPAKDFDSFAKGYDDTARVDVETGAVSSEGAAGSTFFEVPVAIRAVAKNGDEAIFAGCYTARLAQPSIQGVPFQPLHLEKGSLKAAQGELSEVVPASCGDGPPPPPRDALKEQAEKLFSTAYGSICRTLEPGAEPEAAAPEIHDIGFHYNWDGESEPERKARLFRFDCGGGAYNTNEVYYLADDSGELRQLQFASPELDIRYENDNSEGKVESVDIIGYQSDDMLVNSIYDAATKTLVSHAKWRGVGDASSTGTYIFREGTFTLVKYDVDASYDGEINPVTVLDFNTGP
ncbi:DUF1176 domain-containing protein [Mesorhizobium sp. L-8-3]|uniref:DUF1176 domain-containing protein n=1 Tax=Mesorhizobium sp. L-8-3 TaxID=2744522 RepID=UPI001927075E|nr:DUF1176 domain-containing protein [Mesorhizobium sp. L-8-3]BCH25517.1 hypothetical protein MesoLjLb_53020 [Mesorhizobium sp. L-8-3]